MLKPADRAISTEPEPTAEIHVLNGRLSQGAPGEIYKLLESLELPSPNGQMPGHKDLYFKLLGHKEGTTYWLRATKTQFAGFERGTLDSPIYGFNLVKEDVTGFVESVGSSSHTGTELNLAKKNPLAECEGCSVFEAITQEVFHQNTMMRQYVQRVQGRTKTVTS